MGSGRSGLYDIKRKIAVLVRIAAPGGAKVKPGAVAAAQGKAKAALGSARSSKKPVQAKAMLHKTSGKYSQLTLDLFAQKADELVAWPSVMYYNDPFLNLIINPDKQGRHIAGDKNYEEGRSILTVSLERAQELVNERHGTGQRIGDHKERVDFGEVIGIFVNNEDQTKSETKMGIIHYSKTGVHIVPAQPKGE